MRISDGESGDLCLEYPGYRGSQPPPAARNRWGMVRTLEIGTVKGSIVRCAGVVHGA